MKKTFILMLILSGAGLILTSCPGPVRSDKKVIIIKNKKAENAHHKNNKYKKPMKKVIIIKK